MSVGSSRIVDLLGKVHHNIHNVQRPPSGNTTLGRAAPFILTLIVNAGVDAIKINCPEEASTIKKKKDRVWQRSRKKYSLKISYILLLTLRITSL